MYRSSVGKNWNSDRIPHQILFWLSKFYPYPFPYIHGFNNPCIPAYELPEKHPQ